MHLRQLRLQNIACFEDVTLDFTNENGEPCQWIVLLGENGSGKSTALHAIATLIPTAENQASAYASGRPWIRDGAMQADISMQIVSDKEDFLYAKDNRIDLSCTLREKGHLATRIDSSIVSTAYEAALEHLESDEITEGWFAAGYRTSIGGRRFIDSNSEPTSYAIAAPKADRFASLLDDPSRTTSIREWLADLDYRQLKETGLEKAKAEAAFQHAIQAIISVFPNENLSFVEITPTKDVIFSENGLRVSIDSLSDGYRSVMTWVGDLVRRLVEAFPDSENPLHAHGVVLIDEIDLHLHPRWQRTIVAQIRKVFPNLQFIVTTHSPFIAQDMTEEDKIIVLRRDGNHVTATEDAGFVQGWRVDQILTSYLFGLNSTRGSEVESAERQRRDLLDQQAQHGLTPHQQETLDRVNATIRQFKSSPDETPVGNGQSEPAADLNKAADDLMELMAQQLTKPAGKT